MGRSTGLFGESPLQTYPWIKRNLARQLRRWCSYLSQHLQVLPKGSTRETWRRHLGLCPRNSQKLEKKWPWAWYYWSDLDQNSYREIISTSLQHLPPPDSQLAFLDDLGDMLELACSERKEVIIMGDMNYDILSRNLATNQFIIPSWLTTS